MEVNKVEEPVTALPSSTWSSSAYPAPPMGYAHQSPAKYPYAPAAGYGYPPLPHYGAHLQQPPPPGYSYPVLTQQCYGYPPVQPPPQPKKKKKRFGLRWLAGLCGRIGSEVLVHEISDEVGSGGNCIGGGGGCGGGGES